MADSREDANRPDWEAIERRQREAWARAEKEGEVASPLFVSEIRRVIAHLRRSSSGSDRDRKDLVESWTAGAAGHRADELTPAETEALIAEEWPEEES